MYAFVPAFILLGIAVWLYRHETKKEPEMRNKATIMIASYAFIMGIGLLIVSITNWGNL